MDSQNKSSDGQPADQPNDQKSEAVTDITENDILLGRGKSNANHIGNVLFQAMITENCNLYTSATTQKAKKETCDRIIQMVRGRFLRFDIDRSCWLEIDDETARTKIAQAFQYRQRCQTQKDSPDEIRPESPKRGPKRKLSAASLLPDSSNVATYHSMRVSQPFEADNNSVTLDEIRWVLGIQPSLPEQPSMLQQQSIMQHQSMIHQQQQSIPHQQQQQQTQPFFPQSSINSNALIGDNFAYDADYAIGMPAAMRSRRSEQTQDAVEPNRPMNDYLERMRHSLMSLTAASNNASGTSSILMHSHTQHQAQVPYEYTQRQVPASAQQFQDQQKVPNPPDSSLTGSYLPSNTTTGSTMHPSLSLDARLLRQSMPSQGNFNPSLASTNVDNFGNRISSSGAAFLPDARAFDFSRFMGPSSDFPSERTIAANPYDSANVEAQRRFFLPTLEQNVYSTLQQQLLIDPLPLDENEVVHPYDQVMERTDHNNSDKP